MMAQSVQKSYIFLLRKDIYADTVGSIQNIAVFIKRVMRASGCVRSVFYIVFNILSRLKG